VLIFIGGLVRVSGAGLGCPDWPRCFGGWIPPTGIADLPKDVNPATFNFALAWIEYANRLAGVVVGFLMVGVLIQAWRTAKNDRRIVVSSTVCALLVAIQGWLGSVVVSSRLEHYMISLHMGLALVLIGVLIYLLRRVDVKLVVPAEVSAHPAFERRLLAVLGLTLVQIVIGTEVRGEVESIRNTFPLLSDLDLVARLGDMVSLHSILGVAMVLASWYVAAHVFNDYSHLKSSAWLLVGLVLLQMILGMAMFSAGVLPYLQVVHLWTASIYFGSLTHIFVSIRER